MYGSSIRRDILDHVNRREAKASGRFNFHFCSIGAMTLEAREV